jgi:hypothetical protein
VGALVEDVAGRLRTITAGHMVRLAIADDLPPVELDYVSRFNRSSETSDRRI